MRLGGNAWLGGGCALGGAPSLCETLLPRVLAAFGQGHYANDADGLHAQRCATVAHIGQRAILWLTLAGAQAIPDTTTVWLPEMESLYGVIPRAGLSDDQRRVRYATQRRGTDGREASILAAVRGLVPDASTFTTYWQDAQDMGEPRLTLRMGLVLEDAWGDARVVADVLTVVRRQLPSHWRLQVGRHHDRFRCNDPRSLCNTDLLALY